MTWFVNTACLNFVNPSSYPPSSLKLGLWRLALICVSLTGFAAFCSPFQLILVLISHPHPRLCFPAKGRTNVELREQFTLASGVSQSMTPFKSRASVSGASGQRPSVSGPITKVTRTKIPLCHFLPLKITKHTRTSHWIDKKTWYRFESLLFCFTC